LKRRVTSALLVGEVPAGTVNKEGREMTHRVDSKAIEQVVEVLIDEGLEGMDRAFEILMNEAMKVERSRFLGAGPYERTEGRRGYSNGYKPKTVKSRVGALRMAIPQVRGLPPGCEGFYPRSLERGLRSERALKLAMAEMYVQGVSTRRVQKITEELCGLEVSSSDVSRASERLDEELSAWRSRPLGEVPYLILDAEYEKVRHGGSVVDVAVLLAIGVRADGRRSVLGVSVSLSEAEVHWREFVASLQERGLHGVTFITSDDHKGLRAALAARLPGVPWQRSQFHLQRNAQAYVPSVAMRGEVTQGLRNVFNAPDRPEADRQLRLMVERYRESAPRLAAWLEENVPDGLTVFILPPYHRTRMRTTNGLEHLNGAIKRRTRVAGLFPNESSLLRLATAVVAEISEEWEAGKVYLNMESV
jgi:putative transposase